MWQWTPNFVPSKVVVFGCGGTGSRLIPMVAQFMKTCPWAIDPEMTLVDFDHVEEKNLLRQNFIAADVGKNKAVVLANRYSKAYGMTMTAITSRIVPEVYEGHVPTEAENAARKLFLGQWDDHSFTFNSTIFVLCVDSPGARREILQMLLENLGNKAQAFLIDTGNENDFGQVSISSLQVASWEKRNSLLSKIRELPEQIPLALNLDIIPLNWDYYANMTSVTALSCADLDQTMAINCQMAVTAFSVIQNILYVKPMSFHRINVSLQHGSIPEYITNKYLLERTDLDLIGKTSLGTDPALSVLKYEIARNARRDSSTGSGILEQIAKYEQFKYYLENSPKPKKSKKVAEEVVVSPLEVEEANEEDAAAAAEMFDHVVVEQHTHGETIAF